MIRYFLIIMFLLFGSPVKAEWISINGIPQPCFNDRGQIVKCDKKAYGGKFILPDLSGIDILGKCKRDNILYVKVSTSTQADLLSAKDDLVHVPYVYGKVNKAWKVAGYKEVNFKDFKVKKITDKQAEDAITEWGAWDAFIERVQPINSGVTK